MSTDKQKCHHEGHEERQVKTLEKINRRFYHEGHEELEENTKLNLLILKFNFLSVFIRAYQRPKKLHVLHDLHGEYL